MKEHLISHKEIRSIKMCVLLCLWALSGCQSYDPQTVVFPCEAHTDCPSGQICVESACRAPVDEQDMLVPVDMPREDVVQMPSDMKEMTPEDLGEMTKMDTTEDVVVDMTMEEDQQQSCEGSCGQDEMCSGGKCVCAPVMCPDNTCGQVLNSCGSTADCDTCEAFETCDTGMQQCVWKAFTCGDVSSSSQNCTQSSCSDSWLRSPGDPRRACDAIILKAPGDAKKFGQAIAWVNANTLLVGAPETPAGGASSNKTGIVYVYQRDSNGVWQSTRELRPPSSQKFGFGSSIAVSGEYIVIGAPLMTARVDSEAGGAFFYKYDPGTGNFAMTQQVSHNYPDRNDRMGSSVAIDGIYAAIGSPENDVGGEEDAGLVHLYRREGNNWTVDHRTDVIAGPDSHARYPPQQMGFERWRFGTSVLIRERKAPQNPVLFVGAPAQNTRSDYDLVHHFERTSSGSRPWEVAMTSPHDGTMGWGRLGASLAQLENGSILAGAPELEVDNGRKGALIMYHAEANNWSMTSVLNTQPESVGKNANKFGSNVVTGVGAVAVQEDTNKVHIGFVQGQTFYTNFTLSEGGQYGAAMAFVDAGPKIYLAIGAPGRHSNRGELHIIALEPQQTAP